MIAQSKPLFPLGSVVATPACVEVINKAGQSPTEFLRRHQHGDWGNICEGDWQLNQSALEDGSRLMSVYKINLGKTIWCITEADRSVTTLLLPSEY